MKLFIICSKAFYNKVEPIQHQLEKMGHETVLPNSYDNPNAEKEAYARLGKSSLRSPYTTS